MACPFFMPIEKLENGTWLHVSRLPLGCGWSGQCTAPGHEGETPSQEELQENCNLGYAESCPRMPSERKWDSVRFAAKAGGGNGKSVAASTIEILYVCERRHLPAEHGTLSFDATRARWNERHHDGRVQRMAECFLGSWLEERRNLGIAQAVAD